VKALVCQKFGGPEDLVLEECEEPRAGPGQVLVRTAAVGLNFADTLMLSGAYQAALKPPFVAGSELCGTCIAVGSGVATIRPGQRVNARGPGGAFAEIALAPAERSHVIPDAMPFEVGAGFYSGYTTACYALKQRAQLQAGETLVVLAAGGGTGLAAVDLGVNMGARVIAVAGSDEKLALAGERGASTLINYKSTDLDAALREATDNQGADLIFDPVGADLFDVCVRRMRWNGRYLVVGFAGGRIPSLAANLCLVKGFAMLGVSADEVINREPEINLQNQRELGELYSAGKLKPEITVHQGLERIPALMQALNAGQTSGKLVVQV
jgi:NADPH2:quinone reductase